MFRFIALRRPFFHLTIVLITLPMLQCVSMVFAEEPYGASDQKERVQRFRESVEWLASPEREGRGPGTDGIRQASEWIANQFQQIGLQSKIGKIDGFQPFSMTLEATLGDAKKNHVRILGPENDDGSRTTLVLDFEKDFTPLAVGGSGDFDLPLVFAGYGITARVEEYDDYAPLASPASHASRAKGAAVIVVRQEPQKNNPHSVFEGNQSSRYAALVRKVANASEHEAGGVIFCNDSGSEDTLMKFTRAGDGSTKRTIPILHIRREVIDRVIEESLGRSLTAIEKTIDETFEPQSKVLQGWRIQGSTSIQRTETQSENVLAMLPGVGKPATSDLPEISPHETIILGAHFDHLGYGGKNSAAPGERAIHHGADDNASGTAMLVEVASILKRHGPFSRSIVFIAFSGEERGLLGSAHYTANAVVPLVDTVAMVNLDMVGRLSENKLIIHGTGTGKGFDSFVDRLVEGHGFDVAKEPGGFGPSDHSSFYAKKIPVLHVFTGSHSDYHRPTDTPEKIEYEGMARIASLVAEAVAELAEVSPRPSYIEVASKQFAGGGGDRPYFGSIPDFGKPGGGYAITGVAKDSPAAKGGLKGGDVIVRLGDSAITGLEDFDSALRKHKADESVVVVVQRGDEKIRLRVTLGKPK
ncbi:MAG: M28 family peptidase [Pirellulales bacterium]